MAVMYFPLIIDRWIAGTRFLTFEERGAYLELLIYLYEKRGRYIKDEAHVSRILRTRPQKTRRIWAVISSKFVKNSQGFHHTLVRDLQRNGLKFKGLQQGVLPTDPDPDPDLRTKKRPPSGVQKKVANGTRLPSDWMPQPSLIGWAKKEFEKVNLKLETEKFRDYWLATPGQKGRKSDWNRTWRNWIRKAGEEKHNGRRYGRPTFDEIQDEARERLDGRAHGEILASHGADVRGEVVLREWEDD